MQNQNELQNYDQEQNLIQLENARAIQDTNFVAAIPLPAAGSTTVYTPALNLGQSFASSESYVAEIDIDPMATLGAGNTLTAALQDSADGVTFADIALLAPQVTTGNTTQTTTFIWQLPPSTRQYLRARATTGASITSTLAGENATLYVKF